MFNFFCSHEFEVRRYGTALAFPYWVAIAELRCKKCFKKKEISEGPFFFREHAQQEARALFGEGE